MLKYIIARLRWGKLSQEDKEILKTMPVSQVFSRPYLNPKLYTQY
jgi:hypothetical protein